MEPLPVGAGFKPALVHVERCWESKPSYPSAELLRQDMYGQPLAGQVKNLPLRRWTLVSVFAWRNTSHENAMRSMNYFVNEVMPGGG